VLVRKLAFRERMKRHKQRKLGIFLMSKCLFLLVGIIISPNFFLSQWTFGILGVYAYALLALGFFVGLGMFFNKKYRISFKYSGLSTVLLVTLLLAMHIAFTTTELGNSSFGPYLTHGFSNLTPGGLLFALPAFMMHSLLFLEGSLVLLGVIFVVTCAFLTNFIISAHGENKVIKRVENQSHGDEVVFEHKLDKSLDKKLEEKYQELLEEQSRKKHNKNKSALGLFDTPTQAPKREATYDEPIPLAQLSPNPNVTDQINEWSTAAAHQFNKGIREASVETRLKAPLFNSLGPNYIPKLPAQETGQNQLFSQPVQSQPTLFNAPQPQQQYVQPPMFNYVQPPNVTFPSHPAPSFSDDVEEKPVTSLFDRGNFRQTEIEMPKPVIKAKKPTRYSKPHVDLIRTESSNPVETSSEAIMKQQLLDSKLKEFGVNAKVTNFVVAPAVTRFEIQLATGTRVADVTRLETDIAYALGSANVRLETTIEGKNAIGVEVPNKKVGVVSIKDLVASKEFMNHKSQLAVVIGKNVNDEMVIGDISTMPHLLIAGSTGSGKSVMLNTILTSLLFRAHPDDVKLLLVDMKRVELNMYNDIPHMLIPKAIKEVTHTINALKWMQTEMTRRYDVLEQNGVNNIGLYQSLPAYQNGTLERMPYILMVIDEAADLLARGKKEVEDAIKSLSALARACGIHIILATQRPSVDVITGVIKTNFPVRIAFKVGSRADSQTIINEIGAEKLVGRGDMLFVKEGTAQRVQGAYIELDETRRVMNYIRDNNEAEFDTDLEDRILNGVNDNGPGVGFGDADQIRKSAGQDPYFVAIAKWIVRDDNVSRTVSISQLQRQFSLGFSRAGKIIDQLTQAGFVSLGNGSKARDVIVSPNEIEELYGE